MNNKTDKELWISTKRKDRAAFNHLYNRYVLDLFNYGLKITFSEETIKDVIQHLFMDLWGKSGSRTTPNHIKAYLFKSFRNNLLRAIKKEQKTIHYNIEVEQEPISITELFDNYEEEDRVRMLQIAISKLPSRQREIIYLRYFQGLKNKEISELININSQSTANLLHRSITSLKALIVNKKMFIFFIFTTYYLN